jgi:N6-L-threonylcarbamoyladenine synthase
VVAGGVSANLALRAALRDMVTEEGGMVYFPRHEFCTDNGAMIAYVGCQRLLAGEKNDLSIRVYPRWPLDFLL